MLSKCTEQETIEMLEEGMKRAASIARQLARAQKKTIWLRVAILLDKVGDNACRLASARSLSRVDTMATLDVERRKLGKTIN